MVYNDDIYIITGFNKPDLEEMVEDHVKFIFKDEIFRRLEEEKNKCLRSILWTAEIVVGDKQSNEFVKLRKSVLDSVNEFHRKMFIMLDRYLV